VTSSGADLYILLTSRGAPRAFPRTVAVARLSTGGAGRGPAPPVRCGGSVAYFSELNDAEALWLLEAEVALTWALVLELCAGLFMAGTIFLKWCLPWP
jgi:hypothetical protein